MNIVRLMIILITVALIQSCSSSKNRIFWVSGVKIECSSGAGKTACLNVHRGVDIANPNWENFYAPIDGFDFIEGYLQKIEVRETKLDNTEIPADASYVKYTLVKVLDQQKDNRTELNGSWKLVKINANPLNRMVVVPAMTIDLSKNILAAHGGCNDFSGKIKLLTQTSISLGEVAGTAKACINKNIETEFKQALNSIASYDVNNETLTFFNENDKEVLRFLKNENNGNISLHDIWVATRIEGNPINRMSPAPRLEINLTAMRVMGNDGCNDYSGEIKQASDNQLILGTLISTEKLCSKMETPNRYNTAMNKVKGYRLKERSLILVDDNGNEVLSFLKSD